MKELNPTDGAMFEEAVLLMEKAQEVRKNAYTPYSHFAVGAALLGEDGAVYTCCNVENAAYSPGNCAERTALFSVIANGYNPKDIVEIIIIADTVKPVSPCGACREVMKELLNADTTVTLFNLNKDVITLKVKDLLPYGFEKGDLNE